MNVDFEPGEKVLLLGNSAIARGAIEAGVNFCTAYPGTPSSEIMETFLENADKFGHYAEWSTNEKVALEAAGAAAATGLRAMASMKCQGLNVASDFLLATKQAGTKGGFVVVVADDPGSYATTTEIDTRNYAKLAEIPLLEPSSPNEAKEMTKWAFSLSEHLEIPILLRTVTRLSHSTGEVDIGKIHRNEKRIGFPPGPTPPPEIPSEIHAENWYATFTPYSVYLHKFQEEKLEKARSIFEESKFNNYKGSEDARRIIITSGSGYFCSNDALERLDLVDDIGILKLGTSWPIPQEMIRGHLLHAEEVLFVEEIYPFYEENIKEFAAGEMGELGQITFYGKKTGHIPKVGEINEGKITSALKKICGKESPASEKYFKKIEKIMEPNLIDRGLALCPGCPYRAAFWAIRSGAKRAGTEIIVTNDIGCYSLAMISTGYSISNTIHCMGSGFGTGYGFSQTRRFGFDKQVVSLAGDSTFYHASIPAMINAKHHNADIIFVILDNGTTAMTGHQPHPGMSLTGLGEEASAISIENICRSMDIETVVQDPLKLSEATEVVQDLLRGKGTRALIFRSPCALKMAREEGITAVGKVDPGKCRGSDCSFCIENIRCPALSWAPQKDLVTIDESSCNGCGLCTDLCPFDAIEIEDLK